MSASRLTRPAPKLCVRMRKPASPRRLPRSRAQPSSLPGGLIGFSRRISRVSCMQSGARLILFLRSVADHDDKWAVLHEPLSKRSSALPSCWFAVTPKVPTICSSLRARHSLKNLLCPLAVVGRVVDACGVEFRTSACGGGWRAHAPMATDRAALHEALADLAR